MSEEMDRIQNALYALHSRLGVIEGKVNLVARAEREHLLSLLEEEVRDDPLIAQIYLLLNGKRAQRELLSKLDGFGIRVSESTVSRRTDRMYLELGIAEPADTVEDGRAAVYLKDRAMEQVLNLSKYMKKWLRANGETIPERGSRRRKS
jgi:hypothetical protein